MDPNGDQSYPYAVTSRKSEYPLATIPRNSVDPRLGQMATRSQSNWNTGSMYQPNPDMRVSHIEPHQYSQTAPLVRSDVWGPTASPNNSGVKPTTNDKSSLSCPKFCQKMTSTKMVFFLIGLILCGIPLAVMATLWVNQHSSSTVSSTAASVTTLATAASSVSLPIQCYAYGTLNDVYRNYQNYYSGCCYPPYDIASSLPSGWYRISGSSGTQLYTTPVSSMNNCGGNYPGYFNGTLPTTAGALTTGNVCFYTGTVCGYSLSPISAINCNGYYIFFLIPTSSSSYKYCTTN